MKEPTDLTASEDTPPNQQLAALTKERDSLRQQLAQLRADLQVPVGDYSWSQRVEDLQRQRDEADQARLIALDSVANHGWSHSAKGCPDCAGGLEAR